MPFSHRTVGETLDNWLALLESDDTFFGPHAVYIGHEVGDDYRLFQPFIDQESFLWAGLLALTGLPFAEYRLKKLAEAKEVANRVASYIEEAIRERSPRYGVALNSLSDLAKRLLVVEKKADLASLREEFRAALR